jgi:hypothetical protein
MSVAPSASVFHVVDSGGPIARRVLRSDAGEGSRLIVISGFRGTALPERMTRPELAGSVADQAWRISCAEGVFEFHARAIDRIDMRPDLYEPMHDRFALSAVDRIAVRLLLRALRFPGGARVLRWWQSRR